MGYDATALAIIGVRIVNLQKLHVRTTKKNCSHVVSKDAKFCPECGAANVLVTETSEISEYNPERPSLAGFEMYRFCEQKGDPELVIGLCLKADSGDLTFKPIPDIEAIKADMRKKLEPLGVWDEKKFGIYAVLSESY